MWNQYQDYADSMHGMMQRADDATTSQHNDLWAQQRAYAASMHGKMVRADDAMVPYTPIENLAAQKQFIADTLHPTIRNSQILSLSGRPRKRSGSMLRSVRSTGMGDGNTLAGVGDVTIGSTTIPTWALVTGGLAVGGVAAWFLLRKK